MRRGVGGGGGGGKRCGDGGGYGQTPSTGLRHPSFKRGRCRKAMLGVWVTVSVCMFLEYYVHYYTSMYVCRTLFRLSHVYVVSKIYIHTRVIIETVPYKK